jgi:hypothetical protein
MTTETHHGLIVDQFTRQAVPFSTASPITDENALRTIIEAARPQPTDTVASSSAPSLRTYGAPPAST